MSRFLKHKIIALAALLLFLVAEPAGAQTGTGRFLVLSDFHFDPFDGLTRDQFERLAAATPADWPKLLAGQPAAAHGRDAPFSLFHSSLDDAAKRCPEPDFILCPGDFLAHSWQDKYDRLALRTRSQDPAAYRAFTATTMRVMAERIQQAFPKASFLPVLGNEDSYCGDYMIAPDSPFLSMLAEVWGPLLQIADAEREAFAATFARGGYYNVRLPQTKKHRLVVLNSVFFAPRYENACGDATATPALDELAWFEETLAAAEMNGDAVWLLMHIPPGIDNFSTSRANGTARPFWQPELLAKFLRLSERFQSTLQIGIAGHSHMDDFRLILRGTQPPFLTKIVPSISPIFRNNPGYQMFDYDRASGAIENYTTCFLPLGEFASDVAPAWQAEYDFRKTYRLAGLNATTIVSLAEQLTKEGPAQAAYLRHYAVSGPAPPIAIKILACAILNTTSGAFNACFSGAAPTD